METTLSLRGHHLICLHFFCGEGYSPDFAEHLRSILERAENRGIEVCSGADDVCRRCPHLFEEQCRYNKQAEDDIREMDQMALELLGLSTGMAAEWSAIGEKLPLIFPAWNAACCADCDWKWACEGKTLYREIMRKLPLP